MSKCLCVLCVVALVGVCLVSGCKSEPKEPSKPDSGAIGKVAGGVKDRADDVVKQGNQVRSEEGQIMEENQ